ncbi:hypothetical protein DFH09DRAFT_1328885 [Mycena vulgaris]|nr:hypothetical protein DFH09DRAFT_1328885 [Mycena vulgaris]
MQRNFRTTTFVHPVTGHRINLHTVVPTQEDRGVPDTSKELAAKNPPVALMCCTRCKANGNIRILYCSKYADSTVFSLDMQITYEDNHRQCQTTDYKIGRPPTQPAHKLSCGKTHVEEPADESLAVVIRQLDRGDIKLYTKSPTTALQAQVEFLANNSSAHYGCRRLKNGKYVAHQIQGKGGELFLQMRAEAMERRELASIALMEKLLAISTLPTDLYKVGDYVPQLEQEYEIDLEECHFALQRSVRHRELFDEWLTWTTPRIRDGAPGLGVRFGLPWYYLDPPGEFTHPVKYGGQGLESVKVP